MMAIEKLTYAVSVRSVSKAFGSTQAMQDVSFDVIDGQCYGLIGPNGAGKTTCFSTISGFLHPDHGMALVLDHDSRDTDVLRGRLSVLPQDALLPPYETVGEFLIHLARLQGYAKDEAEKQARTALDDVEGTDWWNTKCGKLSHGMAKRVGLAQAFLGNPEVVLLDEPTAGLDPRIAFEVRRLIKKRKGRCTLIISSHNLHELEEICDSAAIMDHGRVVATGTMEELTAASREVRFALASAKIPEEQIGQLPMVQRFEFDKKSRELAVYFDEEAASAEEVIAQVLRTLLDNAVPISGVWKGRGLEQSVMELTE